MNATVRTVRNGTKTAGRPKIAFTVGLGIGKSIVHKGSLRGKILQHLRDTAPHTSTIDALETKFGAKARGAVQKLTEAGWLKRIVSCQSS